MKHILHILSLVRIKEAFFFLFVFCSSLVQGEDGAYKQIKPAIRKADLYFNNHEYSKAIPLYKKEAGKNDEALRKLADCYRIVKNYSEAEKLYGQLASKQPTDPMVYYYYGEALLTNNKYEDAKKQFNVYSSLNPGDKKADLYAKACDNIKELLVKPALYRVYNLGNVNSPVSDFCPVFYKEGIVFTSERARDLVNYSVNSWTGNPYLTLVYAKAEKPREERDTSSPNESLRTGEKKDTVIYDKANILSEKLSGDGHYGPACFNADFSEMYFTKVDNTATEKSGAGSQPKLYYWSKYGKGWRNNSKVLPFASQEYATGHPAISKDGQYLYFASNMPGGQGGTDIWVSKRESDIWEAPQNLGAEINTPGDESFPYISPDNILYFSSNNHAGFGGLDIFSSVQKDGEWSSPNNMMPPVNSTGDDFGIIFKDDNNGYFSSNRMGGKGSDDLYGFALSGLITSVSGKILLSNKPEDVAQNVKVFLLTDQGTILQTTTTDRSGFFRFNNLLADQNYTVRVDETDASLVNQKKFYLADAKNKVMRVAVKGNGGLFIFENLPHDLATLSPLAEEDASLKKISIAGNMYAGDEHAPMENIRVNLLNDKGEVVQSTTTNAFGSFVFMNISPDENFTVTLDDADTKLASQKIFFTNKSGKEIAMGSGSDFKFRILASDVNALSLLKVEDSQLQVDLKGTLFADKEGKNRLTNSNISLVDESGNVVGTGKTDASGNFIFVNLPADKNYMVRLQEDDPALSSKEVFLADAKGKIIATLKSRNGDFFRYSFLPMDEQSLSTIYFDDPWLKVAKMQSQALKDSMANSITIIENIYYEYQKSDLLPQTIITLNKAVDVMRSSPDITIGLISHTDSRGSGEFNLKLSEMRAQTAVDYIIAKGIDKKRLTATGMGESQLVNSCKDDVECSEEEHAQNRRTEFKVSKK